MISKHVLLFLWEWRKISTSADISPVFEVGGGKSEVAHAEDVAAAGKGGNGERCKRGG